ncbi:hypothetical protein HR45_07920 [Shewanella mangrovi]|uniref:Uncharacterized protein n=1 Tax=Shewanella mangrovi TaxID=1515746 RepID=A0A094JIB8_9GAMM|nr:hypothetical protein HR45_07920 [Shewanella mangrovi]
MTDHLLTICAHEYSRNSKIDDSAYELGIRHDFLGLAAEIVIRQHENDDISAMDALNIGYFTPKILILKYWLSFLVKFVVTNFH